REIRRRTCRRCLGRATLDISLFPQAVEEGRRGGPAHHRRRGGPCEISHERVSRLRARRERPRRRRAAECGQQFPPSDGDCHAPLPCEVRKWNDTTPLACSLHVREGGDAAAFRLGTAHWLE